MSITIDLPAPVLAALQEEADATGQPIELAAVEVLKRLLAVSDGPDMAMVAMVEEGLADARAGRLVTIEQIDADIEAALAHIRERRQQQEQAHAVLSASAALDEAA